MPRVAEMHHGSTPTAFPLLQSQSTLAEFAIERLPDRRGRVRFRRTARGIETCSDPRLSLRIDLVRGQRVGHPPGYGVVVG